jgi:hypothetical protein
MAVQGLGAFQVVPSMQLAIAGEPMVQTAPVDAEHWHGEHVRPSSTDA